MNQCGLSAACTLVCLGFTVAGSPPSDAQQAADSTLVSYGFWPTTFQPPVLNSLQGAPSFSENIMPSVLMERRTALSQGGLRPEPPLSEEAPRGNPEPHYSITETSKLPNPAYNLYDQARGHIESQLESLYEPYDLSNSPQNLDTPPASASLSVSIAENPITNIGMASSPSRMEASAPKLPKILKHPPISKTLDNRSSGAFAVSLALEPDPVSSAQPYPWRLTLWSGIMTRSEILPALSIFGAELADSGLVGLGASRTLMGNSTLQLEGELQFFQHFGIQDNRELTAGLPFRWTISPQFSVALVNGLSYATEIPEIEDDRNTAESQLLYYLALEGEYTFADHWSVALRLHHRSGVWGLVNGAVGGSNAYLLGARYRF